MFGDLELIKTKFCSKRLNYLSFRLNQIRFLKRISFLDFYFNSLILERYIAICHPLKARYLCTRKRTQICVFYIWVLSGLASLPVLLGKVFFFKYNWI